MKKSKRVTLVLGPVLSAALLAGCGSSPDEEETRDVYRSMEECLQDWNTQELCERVNEDDEREYRSSHGGVFYPIFWGPRYYPSDRSVIYQGRTVSPSGRSTSLSPFRVTSRSSAASRGGASSPRSSVSTGGFGSSGVRSGS